MNTLYIAKKASEISKIGISIMNLFYAYQLSKYFLSECFDVKSAWCKQDLDVYLVFSASLVSVFRYAVSLKLIQFRVIINFFVLRWTDP